MKKREEKQENKMAKNQKMVVMNDYLKRRAAMLREHGRACGGSGKTSISGRCG